jgi:hypothetical protein
MAWLTGIGSQGNTAQAANYKREACQSSDKGSNPPTHGMEE